MTTKPHTKSGARRNADAATAPADTQNTIGDVDGTAGANPPTDAAP